MYMEESITTPESPQPTSTPPAWGWRSVGLAALVSIGALIILSLMVQVLTSGLGLEVGSGIVSPVLYLVMVGFYLSLIGGVYLFAARHAGWQALGVRSARRRDYLLVIPLYLAALFLLILINSLIVFLIGDFENPQIEAISGGRALTSAELVMLLLLVAGLVPFAEELFFRGMIYPLMRYRASIITAIALNAAAFTVVHVIPVIFPALFVLGLLLAYLRERSGSIWPSVLLHMMQNGLAILAINAALAGT
ncbi:CPBP family intramembrane metalloprotease [Candidatus Chloroploca sp. M-50]|uniref:CPBP family intramembrane metalloprotease n=1 Tax=Candidatus Chloroploca mongolica TaxID=2528176 RepID=A0ABS4D7M0_9CHLR|nr:type II CAAX endopeptidase family protein [Candidatus Chloroploca mongolica]MBP1465437.1 CPBP family intramembrane metalloprotease [Candidatus Chloroploca mongolica]